MIRQPNEHFNFNSDVEIEQSRVSSQMEILFIFIAVVSSGTWCYHCIIYF